MFDQPHFRIYLLLLLPVFCLGQTPSFNAVSLQHGSYYFKADFIDGKPELDSTIQISALKPEQLKALFKKMYIADQQFRDSVHTKKPTGPRLRYFWRQQRRHDKINQVLLAQIFEKYGWPASSIFGTDAPNIAFFILLHSEADYRERYTPLAKEARQKGILTSNHITSLKNR